MRNWVLLAAVPFLVSAAPVRVVAAKLYLERTTPSGIGRLTETTRIPYEVGTACYRWVITVARRSETRKFTEKFTLPGSAPRWGDNEGSATQVAPNREAAITEVTADLSQGVITNGWCVAEGDPAGRYKIEVFDGKRLLRRFDFDVVLPPKAMS
jgi:hypothetical protein